MGEIIEGGIKEGMDNTWRGGIIEGRHNRDHRNGIVEDTMYYRDRDNVRQDNKERIIHR